MKTLAYLKFFIGIILVLYAHFYMKQYNELMIIIAGLIIMASGVKISFNKH